MITVSNIYSNKKHIYTNTRNKINKKKKCFLIENNASFVGETIKRKNVFFLFAALYTLNWKL